MASPILWIAAALIASAAQTARNAAQSSLTRVLGTVGATQVRFLFGLPFAVLFLGLVALATGEAIPALNLHSLGFTAMGAVAQIGATVLMLIAIAHQSLRSARLRAQDDPAAEKEAL